MASSDMNVILGRQLEATMLWVDKETVAICKDEWSILLGKDGKPYQVANV